MKMLGFIKLSRIVGLYSDNRPLPACSKVAPNSSSAQQMHRRYLHFLAAHTVETLIDLTFVST